MKTPFVFLCLLCFTMLSFPGCVSVPLVSDKAFPLVESQISGGNGPEKIAMIQISGLISQSVASGGNFPFGSSGENMSMVALFKEQLNLIAGDPQVRALVIVIDSPGGEVTASDILYHELQLFRKYKRIPVIANIVSVGASGGYYAAMGADYVMAHPTAITGSIGVIMSSLNYSKLLKNFDIQEMTYKSGKFKDMGSTSKPINPEETELFQELIDSSYEQFVKVVAEGRKMEIEKVKKLADGRIYTAQQAQKLGLIDQIGYLEETLQLAKKRAGVLSPQVVTYHRQNEYKSNVYNQSSVPSQKMTLLNLDLNRLLYQRSPKLLYLWSP